MALSAFTQGTVEEREQRFQKIGKCGAIPGAQKNLGRHAGDKGRRREFCYFGGGNFNFGAIVGTCVVLIDKGVGRYGQKPTDEVRNAAAVERGDSQCCRLAR